MFGRLAIGQEVAIESSEIPERPNEAVNLARSRWCSRSSNYLLPMQ